MDNLIRQPKIKVFINNKDVTRELSDFILEVVYTDSIEEKAKDLPTPALIVVGEVVNLRDELKWFD